MDDSDLLAGRLRIWNEFQAVAVEWTCDKCRKMEEDLRETPVGALCLDCWLKWEECGECKVGAAMYTHRDMRLCLDCYLPPMTKEYLELEKMRFAYGRENQLYYAPANWKEKP